MRQWFIALEDSHTFVSRAVTALRYTQLNDIRWLGDYSFDLL